ncbi:MAG: hypothetical protein AAFY57_15120 [Cyanobacteria bacterium J06642_2]
MKRPHFSRVRRWAIALVAIAWLWSSLAGAPVLADASVTAVPSRATVTQRLQAIADELEFVRFCNRASCRYRDIEVSVSPVSMEAGMYEGEITAVMDRPSTTIDKARYRFEFDGDRWRLLGGEELSDVSSFFFSGEDYEVYSAYSGRTRLAKLQNADTSLRVGYRDIYFLLMKDGVERVKANKA